MGRPPIGKVAMTGAERVRLYRLKHATAKPVTEPVTKPSAAAVAEISALRAELAIAKARIKEMSFEYAARIKEMGLEYEARAAAQARRFRDEAKRRPAPAKPRAEKPTLPPDEERDRQIKSLKTRVQNLRAELQHEREHARRRQDETGRMDFQTTSAIAKALHPDHTPSEVQRGEACRLFTAWKSDNARARRRQ